MLQQIKGVRVIKFTNSEGNELDQTQTAIGLNLQHGDDIFGFTVDHKNSLECSPSLSSNSL